MEGPLKVLLICKDARIRRDSLFPAGAFRDFELTPAESLDEGRERAAEIRPDVIWTGLEPAGNGKEKIFKKLGDLPPDLPWVLGCPAAREAEAVRALKSGADDYILWDITDASAVRRLIISVAELGRLRRRLGRSQEELKQTRSSLEKLTFLDPPTGLFNRRGLQQALSLELKWAQRDNEDLPVLIANLDNFGELNRRLGRTGGDRVLHEVAERLKGVVRGTDYVGRIGADQFLVLLPESRLMEGIRIAENVCRAVSANPVRVPAGGTADVTIRLDLVLVSFQTPSIDEILTKMPVLKFLWDGAGRKVRRSFTNRPWQGRGQVREVRSRVLRMLQREKSIRAVKQPIVDLEDKAVVGYEFLSRSTVKAFQMPEVFFRACMEDNILTLVDHQCMKTCAAAARALPPHVHCHLNLFPSTLIDIPAEHLAETLCSSRERPAYCVEISEQQIIGDPSYLSRPVEVLRKSGLRIAIDDVGFGRSCLESLILLEPDVVKIDKKCISGLARDRLRIRSLKRLLKIAEALGAEVVAEGIESTEDLDLVKSLGVKYGQGFFLGRPR